ncbi:Arc family DNA-binding protein [Isoptericola aurantiacus]|uniref:Arc family DNA-binding protein n=1 Tax=Isoptericola aurantiacus TaxID=3377839 RepID=UPI003839D8EF
MDLNRYVETLQHQLATAAAAGGEEARELAARLTAPLDAAARLVLLDAVSDAAGEISAELAPGSVDVRLRSGSPEFVVAVPDQPGSRPDVAPGGGEPAPAAVGEADTGATTRTTLRLPDHLKTQVETAAARDGLSVNSWLVRAVAASLEQPGPRTPDRSGANRSANHVTGWVR